MAPKVRSLLFLRIAVSLGIFVLSGAGFWLMSGRLVGHIHKYWGSRFLTAENHGVAEDHLDRALGYIPRDDEIHRMLGKLSFDRSLAATEMEPIYRYGSRSAEHFSRALALNPMDAESAYGMARVRERLEVLTEYGYPDAAGPESGPLHYYRTALELRPGGIRFTYGLARYLHRKGMAEALRETVERLVRVSPSVVPRLRSEPFWSPEVRKACMEGLRMAIQEGTALRRAHERLSALLAEEEAWAEAVDHYRAAMEIDAHGNTANTLFHLGGLHLKAGNEKQAFDLLVDGLTRSRDPEAWMKKAFGLFAGQDRPHLAAALHAAAQERYPRYRDVLEILWARFLMGQNRPEDARGVLEGLAERSNPEAYFLLARIAQRQGDWDRVELAIQKATLLDPRNLQYRLMFSQVLQRFGKLDRAEMEADAAIRFSPEPTPGIYNHRAGIRWKKGEYRGAAEDWGRAFELAPDRAVYRSNMGRAQEKLGNKHLALSHYRAALELDPDNERYRKQLRALARQE